MKTIVYPVDFDERMKEYNEHVRKFEEKRKNFCEENPNHPFKEVMYLNVIAPPQKITIIIEE